ncbi:MAG TPA: YebC/PmpR family DNA-binding transcriptional regulator [Firmicutes bacterium]|uniref:Probable transcriptional regulatory protein G5B42_10850 n=1 Tax=Capillibacterium thermochitinicola TaxID=2699427 RepID=A0A8J6LNU2_9FIRM|nr:YebC/PmpR family DNA-binding transcriptional regulator [Capillibacterium thermochitinicola]MBA2134028.1 YebC/PmpR family DNA-binding transcriptional regulator [Capillibacterium thermochitinicola]HHW12428.1 YebC/PmpR family DNA-binding transcriptional regulator [Bacillota bacterium]
MAGHSKWANIKRKKEKTDAQKAKAFTKVTREIIVATKAGGGDPDGNFQLRLAIQKAKAINMPNDNITRAIKRGLGSSEADQYEEIIYEGYGPGGVAFLVQTLSDNRNRTASEMRYIFSRNNGNLGETGCVAWLFDKKGVISVPKEKVNLDEEKLFELALEAGAEDLRDEDEYYEIITGIAELEQVRNYLEGKIPIEEAELSYLPKNTVTVSGEDGENLLKLVDALEEHDDVQNVYANFEIAEGN